jgi:hypothetical protein
MDTSSTLFGSLFYSLPLVFYVFQLLFSLIPFPHSTRCTIHLSVWQASQPRAKRAPVKKIGKAAADAVAFLGGTGRVKSSIPTTTTLNHSHRALTHFACRFYTLFEIIIVKVKNSNTTKDEESRRTEWKRIKINNQRFFSMLLRPRLICVEFVCSLLTLMSWNNVLIRIFLFVFTFTFYSTDRTWWIGAYWRIAECAIGSILGVQRHWHRAWTSRSRRYEFGLCFQTLLL